MLQCSSLFPFSSCFSKIPYTNKKRFPIVEAYVFTRYFLEKCKIFVKNIKARYVFLQQTVMITHVRAFLTVILC